MKHGLALFALFVFGIVSSAQQSVITVTVASRVLSDGSRSLLVGVQQQLSGQVDEVRIELPGNAAKTAVLMSGPAEWKSMAEGGALRVSGPVAPTMLRFRLTLFDLKELKQVRIKLRKGGKNLSDQNLKSAELPPLKVAGSVAGLLEFPTIVSPGETIEATVLNPSRTPADGQWIIAGVVATPLAQGRLSVRLPEDLQPGSPVRAVFADVSGQHIVDVLSVEETVVTRSTASETPRITSCPMYALVGRSLCVCGNFPPASRTGIRINGQPATVDAASQHVLQLRLSAPGKVTVDGDPRVGFPATDKASSVAVSSKSTLGRNKLKKGQSTVFKLSAEGTDQQMIFSVMNRTPGIISFAGGNSQQVATSGGNPNAVERTVKGVGLGEFEIDYRLDAPPCPCQEQARGDDPSPASRPVSVVVPRRVMATIAAGTPAATLAAAQAIALANGLSVVEVTPLPSINAALAVFEIQDGIAPGVKAQALAGDPRVTLSQPDFVYDTSQATGKGTGKETGQGTGQGTASSGAPVYGLHMIGADRVQTVTRGDGIRVAVIDAGIDTGHTALLKKVADYSDVTRTGWTPDVHGTLVAGVIAGDPIAGAGSGGVAPEVHLVAVKACVAESPRLASARCWSSTLAQGIDIAAQKNVRVMNMSVGGPEDKLLARLVESALRKGIVVVSAVGNDGPNGKPSFPAAFNNVIAVTAVDAATQLYPRATRGSFVEFAAPGVDILSTGPGSRVQLFNGTSAATAFGTGVVALLLRERPNLTQQELNALLRDTAKDLGPAGRDAEFGYGLLDVCSAVAKLTNRKLACQ